MAAFAEGNRWVTGARVGYHDTVLEVGEGGYKGSIWSSRQALNTAS